MSCKGTISGVAAAASRLGADVMNVKTVLAEAREYWGSGLDCPEDLFAGHGWEADVVQPGDRGAHFGRHTQKLPASEVPNMKRAFFVKARKKVS